MIALLLLAQAAAGAPPQSHSVLHQPCESSDTDVVVCARRPERLPLPGERGPPDGPTPSNPDVTGAGALAAQRVPCSARQGGCTVGVDILGAGTAAIRLVGKLIDPDSCCERPGEATSVGLLLSDVVKGLNGSPAAKPDKAKRVAIDLDAPPPAIAGRLSP